MKKKIALLMIPVLLFSLSVCSATEDPTIFHVEEGILHVNGFGPINKLNYVARYGMENLVILGVDGGWNPKRSIAYQEPLEKFNILYVRPSASNDAYAPKRNMSVNEANKTNQERFAKQIVPLLEEKFPTQTVALFGYSRGGWYINELYKELKSRNRKVAFIWCNDGCPGDDRTIYGYPDAENDNIPIYIANSSTGGGKIVKRTRTYGESNNPNIVFFKKYDCSHGTLSAAVAEDLKETILEYID